MNNMFERVNVEGTIAPAFGVVIPPRYDHFSIVFRDHLYVLMGNSFTDYLNDMCWTNDLRRWRRKKTLVDTNGNAIAKRSKYGICEHDGKVYLTGGFTGAIAPPDNGRLNDVYVTEDMFQWKKLKNAPWRAREGHFQISFNGKLWLMGGTDGDGTYSKEIWWTVDGVNWTRSKNAPWTGRRYLEGAIYNKRLYIIGGNAGAGSAQNNDVWYTENCRDWVRMEDRANFPDVDQHKLLVIKKDNIENRLVLIGGHYGRDGYGTNYYSDELWHSTNGNNWFYGGRMGINSEGISAFSASYFNERIVIVGGVNHNYEFSDVWASKGELFGATDIDPQSAY